MQVLVHLHRHYCEHLVTQKIFMKLLIRLIFTKSWLWQKYFIFYSNLFPTFSFWFWPFLKIYQKISISEKANFRYCLLNLISYFMVCFHHFVWFCMIHYDLYVVTIRSTQIFENFFVLWQGGLSKKKKIQMLITSQDSNISTFHRKNEFRNAWYNFQKTKKKKTVILTEMGAEKVEVFSTCIEK